jgi:predicted PurR-regulated permease PerM
LLVLFFLASGDQVRRRMMSHATSSAFAKGMVEVADELQSVVSRYLSLLALINLVQGTVIAVAMAIIGMPVPLVWGAMAFVAEFFPYLGSATMVILLTLVGLASNGGEHVLLAPLIYMAVTTIQNSVVSPVTYGRYLKLSPPAILVSVMVWWLIWGVLGAFLAVPILALLRIVCERQGGKLGALGALIEG